MLCGEAGRRFVAPLVVIASGISQLHYTQTSLLASGLVKEASMCNFFCICAGGKNVEVVLEDGKVKVPSLQKDSELNPSLL